MTMVLISTSLKNSAAILTAIFCAERKGVPSNRNGKRYFITYSKKITDRGYDIFIAKKINSQWVEIGSWDQLNSPYDDLGVEMIDDTTGYFSSNRDSEGQVDKIYFFDAKGRKE